MRLMRSLLLIVLLAAVSITAGGCSEKEKQETPKTAQDNLSVHGKAPVGDGTEAVGMATVIKKQHLAGYSSTTVGEAIDSYRYFTKKEWSESRNSKGTSYVDFTGWLSTSSTDISSIKDRVAARGVQIKFVVYENGSFGVAMVSKVEAKTDGKLYAYPLENSQVILDRIYGNKEIGF